MMKKKLLLVLVLIFAVSFAYGQKLVNAFDEAPPDTNYWHWNDHIQSKLTGPGGHYEVNAGANPDSGFVNMSFVDNPVKVGSGAMQLEYGVHNAESWGGYTKIEHWNPDTNSVYDWSAYDSISFYYYNLVPQNLTDRVSFRLCLQDVSDSPTGNDTYTNADCEYWYSFHKVLDNAPGWNEIKIALTGIMGSNQDLSDVFQMTNWAGIAGNQVLDLDKIKGFTFEFSISGSGVGDCSKGTFILDHMALKGSVATSFIIFNGRTLSSTLSPFIWGQSTLEIEEGVGFTPGSNAIKWTQGDEWGTGWTGAGYDISPARDMTAAWGVDSLRVKIKAESGTPAMRFQFEDGTAKRGMTFTPTGDGEWHSYAFKLSEFVYIDGTSNFDSCNVTVFQFMSEENSLVGRVIYLDDLWTGNPIVDITDPLEVHGVNAITYDYYNLIIWVDVPGEVGESYNVYASREPITDITARGVETIASRVLEDTQNAIQYIYYPLEDQEMTYYYAVDCTDDFGNTGPAGVTGAIVNTAKGIPTISLDVPATFAVDGDLSEWYDSDIKPWVLKPETDNVVMGTVTDSLDLQATVFLAIDDDNLYVAADVYDNVYNFGEGNWYDQDAFEFFIGLFNSRSNKHSNIQRGSEPDYKLQIHEVGIVNEFIGNTIWTPEDPLYFFTDYGGVDYTIEAQIPLDDIAGAADVRFHPKRGMKIPIELYFHDNDGGWEGNLGWSPYNTDKAWSTPTEWGYTWIGDTTDVYTAIDKDDAPVVVDYRLGQNFPNPFNPTTRIEYSIPQSANVSVRVYNMVGQQIAELVNKRQNSGNYHVVWNAADVPSGVYFYQIQAGTFIQTKKMLLIK